jgi:formylglycine-generating enzyme required for sulfatase activity
MNVCPHCGKKHPVGTNFCPTTGKPIPGNPAPIIPGTPEINQGSHITKPLPSWFIPVSLFAGGLLMLAGIILIIISIYPWLGNHFTPKQTMVAANPIREGYQIDALTLLTRTFTPMPIAPPETATPSPSPFPTNPPITETATVTITPAPPLEANPKDGAEIIYIPAGSFTMGADSDSRYFWGAEAPEHQVTLAEYWIYRTEVTNGMYRACAAEKKCPRPAQIKSNTRRDYYENSQYDDYPVIYVSWRDATSYCQWAGGRLPTEAEWEKAARGEDGRMFPWGNHSAQPHLANYDSRDTEAVGSYPEGASPYGVYDMAGNVLEWVFDYFQATYYQASPDENPRGPATGERRVYRGGAWHHLDEALRSAARASARENYTGVDIGFRCVIDSK